MKATESKKQPTHQEIAAYAYQLWESDGRQEGRDAEYWFQAEAQLSLGGASARRDEAMNGATAAKAENGKKRKVEGTATARRQPAYA